MEKYLGFVAILVFLFSCTSIERDNPYDIRASNYREDTSKEGSSSSVDVGNEPSSSSVAPSSSSDVQSSSSALPSSSSEAESSSSVIPSSSSVAPSSSSAPIQSSSSFAQSSSSSSSSLVSQNGDPVTYEGETYQTVVIGTQTWMAKNLNYAPSSGIFISCDTYDCATYGRLYDWSTAMGFESSCNSSTCSNQIQLPHQGICPDGWHLPSDAEWTTLTDYVGSSTAGTKLKAKSGWSSGNGTDDYRFSALPGGSGSSDGSFNYVGDFGYWWSATESGASGAHYRYMRYDFRNMSRGSGFGGTKSSLWSVRCVKD